jgi:hypothetical protein
VLLQAAWVTPPCTVGGSIDPTAVSHAELNGNNSNSSSIKELSLTTSVPAHRGHATALSMDSIFGSDDAQTASSSTAIESTGHTRNNSNNVYVSGTSALCCCLDIAVAAADQVCVPVFLSIKTFICHYLVSFYEIVYGESNEA